MTISISRMIASTALLCFASACNNVEKASQNDTSQINEMEAAAAALDDAAKNLTTATVAAAKVAPNAAVSPKQTVSICKAAIAEINGHSPSIMRAKPIPGNIIRISYNRPDDGKLWKSDCKLEGSRIMWRAVDLSPGSGPGRWRNSSEDEVITFAIHGKKVEIKTKWSDGSVQSATQPLI